MHLRFGKVARGGIRWSDRPQDFRTEILGLVKAQNVKNAVIVPVGAKGGFVPKRLPAGGSREAIQAEGTATYKLFISTLLDITDNIGTGTTGVVPPADVVRHDGDDPYLVVAADKGTATFSDIANELAIAHDFWLGDAFASGGSAGYDHKKMGITARGAWESVKRHFREMDVDIGRTPFTVVGVGDMSGDVFGNGLLRETTTKLVAAFDHRDIFIDPDPDPERAFAERKRLFDLPRSSWQDFDKTLISKGGGVYPRAAKEIRLSAGSAEAVRRRRTAHAAGTDPRASSRRRSICLFFGGIGTYVRAADESDEAAGDRANDADPHRRQGFALQGDRRGRQSRHDAARPHRSGVARRAAQHRRHRQFGRREHLRHGGQYQDRAEHSAARRAARRWTRATRFLAGMTDEVAALVLRNNYLQTLALSLSQRRGMEDFGFLQRLIQTLETRGLLDRAVEFLPDDMALAERRRRSQAVHAAGTVGPARLCQAHALRRPARIPRCRTILISAASSAAISRRRSPNAIPDALEHHRLRREIIATQLANSMINRGGPSLIVRIADQTGAAPAAIASAFAAVRDSYGMTALNAAIDELDNRIPGKLQLDLYAAVQDLLLDRIIWFLRNVDLAKGLADVVAHYRDGIAAVDGGARRGAVAGGVERARGAAAGACAKRACRRSLPAASPISRALTAAPDIVLVADRTGKPVGEVAATYFATGAFFRLDRIASAAEQHPDRRLFRPAGARPRAGFDRRCRAAIDRRHGRQRRGRRRRGRGLGGAAKGRGRAHPRRDPRDRQFRADAVEACPSPRACLGDLVKN